jgi:hypothetical protein
MTSEQLFREAVNCRMLARRYVGRGERPFLLNVAAVFDDLARQSASDVPLKAASNRGGVGCHFVEVVL